MRLINESAVAWRPTAALSLEEFPRQSDGMAHPGDGMDCEYCARALRTSLDSTHGHYKTCPHCSGLTEHEHVFRKWPDEFGTTEARVDDLDVDGSQSWCRVCRADPQGNPAPFVSCHSVAEVEVSEGKPVPPSVRKRPGQP